MQVSTVRECWACSHMALLAMILGLAAPIRAGTIVNGGFELGDLAGWQATGSGGLYYNESNEVVSYPFDFASNPWFSSSVGVSTGDGPLAPNEGSGMLRVRHVQTSFIGSYFVDPDGATWGFSPAFYTVSVQQALDLEAGQIVSGWAAFGTADSPGSEDFASVWVEGDEVWRMGIDGHSSSLGAWEQWEWTAPAQGTYTLSLKVYGDDFLDSTGYFDGIVVSPVPEPSTVAFCIIGLMAGLLSIRRRAYRIA